MEEQKLGKLNVEVLPLYKKLENYGSLAGTVLGASVGLAFASAAGIIDPTAVTPVAKLGQSLAVAGGGIGCLLGGAFGEFMGKEIQNHNIPNPKTQSYQQRMGDLGQYYGSIFGGMAGAYGGATVATAAAAITAGSGVMDLTDLGYVAALGITAAGYNCGRRLSKFIGGIIGKKVDTSLEKALELRNMD